MSIKKIMSTLLILIIPTVIFAGCGSKNTVKYGYNGNLQINKVTSQEVADNSKLGLFWDDSLKCILLENKKTGKIWSNIPMDMYERGEYISTLDISVQDMELYQTEFFSSEDAYNSNKISCKKIDNGVRVTYYFDKAEISIPVEFVLREDSLLMSINGAKIQEKGEKYRLVNVSVSPKFCSVTQGKENSYLFLPEGNGALMSTEVNVDGQRKVEIGSANIASHDVSSSANPPESCGMRVFGIKDNNDAMVCIAEKTPGAVGIYASAGDRKSNYSNVYPVYYFVDYDYFYGKATNAGAVRHLSDRYQSTISVGFYPLENEMADYNGMAKRYREYLIDNGYIDKNKEITGSPYSITLLGGVMSTSSVLGIPVKILKSMTNYTQAKEIVKNITELTNIKPVVRMKGYTETGINIGEIAGGYSFASKFGSEKTRKALESYCKENDIPLFFEFEMIKYSKSGSGFSYSGDSAKTAILHPAEQSGVNVPLRDIDADSTFRYLKRSELEKSVSKLEKMIKNKKLSGVSIATLGSAYYSDYSEGMDYAVTSKIDSDTKKYFTSLKKTKSKIAASAATFFAAGIVDTVFDAPLDISGKYSYDVEIPFYQLVFSGITPLYSSAVNLTSVPEKKIMMAASTGTGLGFTVISDFEKEYMETASEKLYACVYDENTKLIKSSLEKYSKIYSEINGSKIKSYEFLENKVSKTIFENGVVVYANNSSDTVNSPIGELKGFDFGMEREGI